VLSISVHVAWRKLPLEVLMGHVRGQSQSTLESCSVFRSKGPPCVAGELCEASVERRRSELLKRSLPLNQQDFAGIKTVAGSGCPDGTARSTDAGLAGGRSQRVLGVTR
jgi:hypothetical protein